MADESVDAQIIERLRKDGHKILSVSEMRFGLSDKDVLEIANEYGAVLMTGDKVFF